LVTTDCNPNLQPHCYFRTAEFEAARQSAIEVATNRGDAESAHGLATMTPMIEVHDPSAITLVAPPHEPAEERKARSDYDGASTGSPGSGPSSTGSLRESGEGPRPSWTPRSQP
jgi:hypothetical protein